MLFLDEEKFKDKSGIYAIKNTITDKIYVGKTCQKFKKRFWHHKFLLENNRHFNKKLQYSFNLHGSENFIFYVLEEVADNDLFDLKEIEYIKNLDSVDSGYNIQYGGDEKNLCKYISSESRKLVGEKNRHWMTGRKLSDETREKMRRSSKHLPPSEETRKKISEYMRNRIVSDKTREKLRLSNLGEKSPVAVLNNEIVLRIKILSLSGMSTKEIANIVNKNISTVNSVIKNRTWKHIFPNVIFQ